MPCTSCFIIPLNQKTNHIKYKPNMGFLSVSKMARGGGGGDYSREAIILNISVKGGRLFEGGD